MEEGYKYPLKWDCTSSGDNFFVIYYNDDSYKMFTMIENSKCWFQKS